VRGFDEKFSFNGVNAHCGLALSILLSSIFQNFIYNYLTTGAKT